MFLTTTDRKNVGFYETCGFTVLEELVFGEDDPDWDEPGVPYFVVRVSRLISRGRQLPIPSFIRWFASLRT